jgi:carboxymethylenebutenolidase
MSTSTADEQRLIELWERHMDFEFAAKDAAATVETMAEQSWVNHVPG